MNSYNENLHSAIVNSLQGLDIEEQNLKSQVNAAMFTLYHAEGATVTAEQNLSAAIDAFKVKSATQSQAVKDSNVSINLLNSATQASQYVKQTTTNTAVAASNMQIAGNAIMRLSGDIGSISSILRAADYDSDIYLLGEEANKLINQTAYDAEAASQMAMETSMFTAEVSTTTVLDMAKTTNSLMAAVLKITTTDFNTATQSIIADNAAVASVRSTEKLDEGALEMISIAYKTTQSAYQLTNDQLNLNLNVKTSEKNALSFTVNFDLIKGAFAIDQKTDDTLYPVKEYYIMVVKDIKKQTFSISSAENLLAMDDTDVIKVVPPKTAKVSQVVNAYPNQPGENKPAVTDTDNEEIKLGVDYVVFVMAVYTDAYKKRINCYDDYLSAPSQTFTLTTRLEAVAGRSIEVKPYNEKEITAEENDLAAQTKKEQVKNNIDLMDEDALADYTYLLTFETKEDPDTEVEYRCMLLPFSPDVSDRLLTSESLNFLIDNEISSLEEIASEFDTEMARLQAENYTSTLKRDLLTTQFTDLDTQLTALSTNAAQTDENAAQQQTLKESQSTINIQLKELETNLSANTKKLAKLATEKDKTQHTLARVVTAKPGFLFNVPIAEQVYAGSYTVAKKKISPADNTTTQWVTFFGPDTTDNFGNKLNKKEKYLPVILSYSTAAAENEADFVNSLSDMATTAYFEY